MKDKDLLYFILYELTNENLLDLPFMYNLFCLLPSEATLIFSIEDLNTNFPFLDLEETYGNVGMVNFFQRINILF